MKRITSTLSFLLFFYSISFAIDFKGTIKDETNQQPISGAVVRVFKNTDQVASLKTNDVGAFSIPLLMGTDYRVYIDKNGYNQLRVSITTNFSSSITELPSLDLLMVETKTESNPILIRLTGKLYHLQLGGLEGEQITAKNNVTGAIITAVTLSNGNFSLALAPDMSYTIEVVTNGTFPLYEYSPVYLNTSGVNSSKQIIRNFENRCIIIKNETKPGITTQKTASNKGVESTNKIVKNNELKIVTKKSDSISNQPPILNDKDKALLKSLNTKYEKLLVEDSIERKKDKMVARNVVVKFYDDDEKMIEKEKVKPTTSKKIIKPKEVVKKDTHVTKVIEIREKVKVPKISTKLEETKPIIQTKATESQKPVLTNLPDEAKQLANTQKLNEKISETRRIDSIIGTATRFMHRELTSTEKAKLEATKNTTRIVAIPSDDNRLPVLIEEDRTPVINDVIYYGEGKATLDNEAKDYLTGIATKLKTNTEVKIELAIHCDLKDEASVADYICKLRIKKIVDLMVNTLEVNFQQLMIRSIGMNEPVNNCKKSSTNCTELDHQMNRRTEIKYLN